ncbi:glycosyltransferase family 25 protein [Lepidopterella palustris CBS 459.81]|uniref:Glycosyltransferase family 25 protein n=1 Tax=Lepidopterella palustris CBS 459.81 TaxID=1314670 RepID=A0A8E2E4P1_9PEZI|nr:glycosyltransferase family 25 protein [Lepidopterella palustris CBS 459.81]
MYPPNLSKVYPVYSYTTPLSRNRLRTSVLASLITALVLITILSHSCCTTNTFHYNQYASSEPLPLHHVFEPANSTLGFGAILAVSPPESTRRYNLLQAANVTELDITIPELPRWTEKDEIEFRKKSVDIPQIPRSMIFAWMSHLRVLEWFLTSGLETALIIEDDMDWDIRLRSLQAPRVAASIRSFFSTPREPNPATKPNTTASPPPYHHPSPSTPDRFYYGDPSAWDILYLGHFDRWSWPSQPVGVGVQTPSSLTSQPYTLIPDPTLPPRYNMHPTVASLLTALGVPPATRVLHPSRVTYGSWAYGVTRASAAKIITDAVAGPGCEKWALDAFDQAMLKACQKGRVRCWVVFPELMHHREGVKGMIEYALGTTGGELAAAQRDRTGETDQIACGFAGGELEWGDDEGRLKGLREMARMGRCPKGGREGGIGEWVGEYGG